jgi:chromosome segregation ATPase
MTMGNLSLSIVEIIVLMLGAITLGITLHFFITSRRSMISSPKETEKVSKALEEWKLRYFNDTEQRDKELTSLRKQLEESEENNNINSIEADEMRKLNKKLKLEIEALQKTKPVAEKEKPDYIQQLRQAQSSLLEHNEKINLLLGQIDIVKETEEKQQEILKINEELSGQIDDLKLMLSQKEKEISNTRQKEQLTNEMTSMIDSAYNEFNVLQDKIKKLEGLVNASKKINLEYEDLKEDHYRISKDFEEQRKKYNTVVSENKRLLEELTETEDKLKEANYQRQQLQKKVAYLEELNNDMQAVADAHKKLEGQLKRVGELESMLNVVAEERDELVRKQMNT